MNGTMNPDDRVNRKRVLESELEVIRRQKSQVLQAIQQIAKKQKLGGPPSKAVAVTHEAKVDAEHRLHKENLRRMWGLCTKIIAELVKNTNVRLYFGEPVHRDKFPNYYDIIKQPRDLGTIRGKFKFNHHLFIFILMINQSFIHSLTQFSSSCYYSLLQHTSTLGATLMSTHSVTMSASVSTTAAYSIPSAIRSANSVTVPQTNSKRNGSNAKSTKNGTLK